MNYLTVTRISQSIQNRLAQESEYISSDLIKVIIEMFLDEVMQSLKQKIQVRLPYFGVFSVRLAKSRKGVDPITKSYYETPIRYHGKFRFTETARKAIAEIPTEEKITIDF